MDYTTKPNVFKECNKCKRNLPANIIHFKPNKHCKNGVVGTCRECNGSEFGVYTPNRILSPKEGYRYCNKCLRQLPADLVHFNRHKVNKDGLRGTCKECRGYSFGLAKTKGNISKKEGYEICKKCTKEFPLNSKFFAKESKNQNELSGYCRGCYREYQQTREQQRRAKQKHLANTFSKEEWHVCKGVFDNKCAYCGKKAKVLEQDHFIPLNYGGEYTINNIVPSCRHCNASKSDKDFFKWYSNYKYYSKQREQKILKYLNYKENKTQQLALL